MLFWIKRVKIVTFINQSYHTGFSKRVHSNIKKRHDECIINMQLYSKTNQMHNISNLFYFGTTLYTFRTVTPSIIRNLRLYIQHQVHVIQVLWLARKRWYSSFPLASSHRNCMTYTCGCGLWLAGTRWNISFPLESSHRTCMTYTLCCMYSLRLLMMDGKTVRNM